MKKTSRLALTLVVMFIVHLSSFSVPASAQVPSLINYQGRLVNNGALVSGNTSVVFRLYGQLLGGSPLYVETQSVSVVDGLYATRFGALPDFGTLAGALTNSPLFLEVQVGTTTLTPRERVASVCFAQTAAGVEAGAVTTGMLADQAVTTAKLDNGAVTGQKIFDGAVHNVDLADGAVTGSKIFDGSISDADLGAGSVDTDEIVDGAVTVWKLQERYWNLNGNTDATSTNFLGTKNYETLELRVENRTAWRIQPSGTTADIIGGSGENSVSNGVQGATISGGGASTEPNLISDHYGAIGGGRANIAGDRDGTLNNQGYATVSGGRRNTAAMEYSAVGGGYQNTASNGFAVVSGGRDNEALGESAVVGGGHANRATADQAVVAGGLSNEVTATAASVGGGYLNVASDAYATVGGGRMNRAADHSATVAGGSGNTASNAAAVAGGSDNIASGTHSAVGGGNQNEASGQYAAVPGGRLNEAAGAYSLAAGTHAKARHDGTFVWADSDTTDFESTAADQFLVQASGGVGIGTNAPGSMLTVAGDAQVTTLHLTGDEGASAEAVTITGLAGSLGPGSVTRHLKVYVDGEVYYLPLIAGVETVPDGMAYIPGGAFLMGDTYNEGDADETPVHTVYVSPFYMDIYEVSSSKWAEVRNWGVTHGYEFSEVQDADGADHPIRYVGWHDAVKWCNARSEKEDLTPVYYTSSVQQVVLKTGNAGGLGNDSVRWAANGYRLPTEAEWEKAARGGLTGHHYPWSSYGGDYTSHIDSTMANYEEGGSPYAATTPVGYYDGHQVITNCPGCVTNDMANGYGLYDMAGNVLEWCWDVSRSSGDNWYTNAAAQANDPRGPDHAVAIAVAARGGAFDHLSRARDLRCSSRAFLGLAPSLCETIGFRCVRIAQ